MKLDWWTLGLQTINVVILVWLLSRFLFKPVAAIVAERQRLARQLLDEAAAAKQAAEAERAAAEAARAELAGQRAGALQAAEQEAAAAKARLLEQAQAEAAQLREQAASALAAQQQAALALAEQHAARLALDIAAKLLDRLPSGARVAGFAAGLVAGLDELAPASRQALAAAPGPLRLRAPRALAEDELAACRAALSTALGRPVDLEVQVDPGLIAGLELEGAGAVVRNSFRADLARVQQELNHHAPAQP